jgi:polysaccharide biosynthesis transport protein
MNREPNMIPDRTQPPIGPVPGPVSGNGDGSGRHGYGNGYGYGSGYTSPAAGDFARTWHTLVEKAWVILLTTAILLGVGYAYVRTAPVLYSATATIQAEQDQLNVLKMQMVQVQDLQAVDYLQTVAQSLSSRPLLERVADTNKLWTDPRFIAAGTNAPNHNQILNALDKMVKVKLRRGTRLIDISVTHRVPELTEMIANSIVGEYLNVRAEREDTSIGLVSKSLTKEAERLRKKLEESEHALQAYKEKTKASSLDDRENTVVAKLKELSTKATEAKSVRIRAETDYAQAVNLGTNIEALEKVPTVAKDQTVLALQLSLTKAEDDFAALCKRYKAKHPKYIQASTLISELKGDITNAVLNAVQASKATLEGAKAAEEALNEAMQTQETASLELSKLSIQYSVLAREVESDRTLYDAVLKGLKEASVTKETQQTGIIRVVQPAFLPDLPVSPKKAAIMAMSGMGGLFLGFLIVMGLRVTDTSIKTVDEAEGMLGLSVVSVVPNMRKLRNGESPMVVAERAKSQGAEAFRTLRSSLSTLDRGGERRVYLFTSALPAEGKTTCSLNYSASLAMVGLKTLLIDADLRRPAVETALFGKETDSPGLTDYLTGQKKLEQVVRPAKVENLFFITGGSTAANPAEMLAKDGLSGIIQEALKHYDRVVLDSAPITAVSDTLLILKSVQTVCLVVRVARTSSRYVLRCVQLLQGAEAPLAGIILNRMPGRHGPGYGAYYDYRYRGKYDKEGVYGAR